MTASERRESIIAMFQQTNFVKITDIVAKFEISNETARRDLDYLQDQKLIRRVYGGAILKELPTEQSGPVRRSRLSHTLSAIGKAAADLVQPGESIFLTNGSTTLQVARHLRSRTDITVVTNSLAIINELADTDVNLIVIGGHLSSGEHDICGDLASDCVNRFYCNKAIIGCGGIGSDLDIMDYYSRGGMPMIPHVIQRSAQHILVAGSQKFGMPAFVRSCRMEELDIVITDNNLPEEYQAQIRERGIELIMVDTDTDEAPDSDD